MDWPERCSCHYVERCRRIGRNTQSGLQETDGARSSAAVVGTSIERLVVERNEARVKKDFAKADGIRKELAVRGIILEDRPDGTTRWKR